MTEYIEISIRLREYNPATNVDLVYSEFSERLSNIVIDIYKLAEKYKLGFEHIQFNVKDDE